MGVIRTLWRLSLVGIAVWGITAAAVIWQADRALASHEAGKSIAGTGHPGLVLGAGVDPDRTLTYPARARVRLAVDLLAQGKLGVLIMTGGPTDHEGLAEADAMRALALSLGAPAEAIRVERASTSTFENLRFSAALLEAEGMGPPVLLTDAGHLPRAEVLARYLRVELAGLATVDARRGLPEYQQIGLVGREALAWWHNLGRAAYWSALGALGHSPDARQNMLL